MAGVIVSTRGCNQWLGEMKWCVLGVLCRFILVLFILVLIHLLIFVVFRDISLITLCLGMAWYHYNPPLPLPSSTL